MLKNNKSQRGFTLIELLVVIVILAILVAAAITKLKDVNVTGGASAESGKILFTAPLTALRILPGKSESVDIMEDYGLDYDVDASSRTIKISMPEKTLTVKCQLKSLEGEKNCVAFVVARKKAKS